ncbi:MAG TPA: chemotaxis protein CheW [Myxococcaceae bacterium]|nr:chemotaxis protein CheW [Myxococcaceae bacterium]
MDAPRRPPSLAERLRGFLYRPDEELPPLAVLPPPGDEARVAPPAEEVREVLSFGLGEATYALPLGLVLEILRARALVEIPRADPPLLGVLDLRGTVTPVFDLALALGLRERSLLVSGPPEEREPVPREARILVTRTATGPAGLWVDRVRDVVRLPLAAIEEPRGGPAVTGIARRGSETLVLIDPERVL